MSKKLPQKSSAEQIEQVVGNIETEHYTEHEVIDNAGKDGNQQTPQKTQGCGVVLQLKVFGNQNQYLIAFKFQCS